MLESSQYVLPVNETNECKNVATSPKTSRYQQDFVEIARIGKGGYGTVYTVMNKLDGARYAVKKVVFRNISNNPLSSSEKSSNFKFLRVLREVLSLASLNHPNICRYYQAWIEEKEGNSLNKKKCFEKKVTAPKSLEYKSIEYKNDLQDQTSELSKTISSKSEHHKLTFTLYIQMHLYERTLRDWLDTPNHNSNHRENMRIFRQILQGLDYIHQRGIIHRDLKPENIFLTEGPNGNQVCIGDFGLATTMNELEELEEKTKSSSKQIHSGTKMQGVGTQTYASPEQQQCLKYNEKTDIYSLGLIIFELFTCFNTKMERAKVLKDLRKFVFPPDFLQKYSEEAALIRQLLQLNPEDRPSAVEILQTEVIYTYEPFISTPKKELEALRRKILLQEEIIQQQEAMIQNLCTLHDNVSQLCLSPRKQVKRRLLEDKENSSNSPILASALKSQKAQLTSL